MRYNYTNIPYARELRRNMTRQERRLWYDYLKRQEIKFRRQVPIGSYIVDFYNSSLKIAIELDGSQHYEPEEEKYDIRRTEYLNSQGIEVIRIPNNQIDKNFNGVCVAVDEIIKKFSHRNEI